MSSSDKIIKKCYKIINLSVFFFWHSIPKVTDFQAKKLTFSRLFDNSPELLPATSEFSFSSSILGEHSLHQERIKPLFSPDETQKLKTSFMVKTSDKSFGKFFILLKYTNLKISVLKFLGEKSQLLAKRRRTGCAGPLDSLHVPYELTKQIRPVGTAIH